MKIHIIGCSGSGKTYLANALSKKYNISHFDLDDIQWDNNAKEYGKKRTLDERKALLQEILYNNDEWIIEGVYYAWVQQSFDEADKIYVLDMPGYLYKSRIIMRSIKRKLGIQKGKRENRRICGIPHRAGRFRLSRRGNDNGAYDRFHPGNLRRFRDKRR